MSMICNLRRVSDDQIAHLLQHPQGIKHFLYGLETAPTGLFARLFGAGKRRRESQTAWTPPSPDDEIDLDKAWHGLHFLFTGSAWEGDEPLCFLVTGGTEIGDVDVGYGPARALSSQQVKDLADALSRISVDDLRARFDPDRMMELDIYPSIWDRDPAEDDSLGYLEAYFGPLKAFIDATSKQNMGLIIYLN